MTYNVFGGTLNLAQSINLIACADELTVACCVYKHAVYILCVHKA